MFDFICYQPTDSYMPKPPPVSYLRTINAAPGCKKADVYTNGYLIAKKLGYKKFTLYVRVPPGHNNTVIYLDKSCNSTQASASMDLEEGLIYTAAILGFSSIEWFLIPDPRVNFVPGMANVRFVNLCKDMPPSDLCSTDGTDLWCQIGYKGVTDYLTLHPGNYTFQLKDGQSGNTVITIPKSTLSPECNYTVYTVGIKDEKPGLYGFLIMDGSAYIKNPENVQ